MRGKTTGYEEPVDSCGWIEYFTDGPNSGFYAPVLKDNENLIVPTICIVEVYEFIFRTAGEDAAYAAVGAMNRGTLVNLDSKLALLTAKYCHDFGLPVADSIILATAKRAAPLYGRRILTLKELRE